MIPKKIHYCWFGGNPLPEQFKNYIDTWKYYCSDYEIIEWNEKNFDLNSNQYCMEAYQTKQWAFVSDYVRLKVLYDYGGIYMDTDVEVIKPLDDLLQYNAFFGFESDNAISTGIMGASAKNEWISELLKYYDNRHFILQDGRYDTTTNVETITKIASSLYKIKFDNTFQIIGNRIAIFPFDYLCAKDLIDGRVKITKNTYTVHHFAGSWLGWWGILKLKSKHMLSNLLGRNIVLKLVSLKRFMSTISR